MPEPTLGPQKILILLPDRDSPPKKDFTHVFLPEANALKRVYESGGATVAVERIEVPVVDPRSLTIDSADKQRGYEQAARSSIAAIQRGRWDRIIMLCHGWDAGIQLGFRIRKQRGRDKENLASLIASLRTIAQPRTIALFACSAGDEPASSASSPGTGDNSFADYLRDNVPGCSVLAHWTVGHATRNPDLIFFRKTDGAPLIGGVAYPSRGTEAYRNTVKLLTQTRKNSRGQASGSLPPKGGSRPAFASLPLCESVEDLQALLSSEPAF